MKILANGDSASAAKAKALSEWWAGKVLSCCTCTCLFHLDEQDREKIRCETDSAECDSAVIHWRYIVSCPCCANEVTLFYGKDNKLTLLKIGENLSSSEKSTDSYYYRKLRMDSDFVPEAVNQILGIQQSSGHR